MHIFFAFPPKAQNLQNQAGLLARLTFAAFSVSILETNGWCEQKHFPINPDFIRADQTYSCGDSFGFTPNSLLILKSTDFKNPFPMQT